MEVSDTTVMAGPVCPDACFPAAESVRPWCGILWPVRYIVSGGRTTTSKCGIGGEMTRNALGTPMLGLLAGIVLAPDANAQIVFRKMDVRPLEVVPLEKEAYPGMPYMPNPRLPKENILPDRPTFDTIPMDNLAQPNIRPNHLAVPPLVQGTIVQQPIAPKWLEHEVIGPERVEPQTWEPPVRDRKDFEYGHSEYDTPTRPRSGWEAPMFLTPALITDRPPDSGPAVSANAQSPSHPAQPSASGGRRPLGW